MSGHSSPRSPSPLPLPLPPPRPPSQAPRASSAWSKADKAEDVYDANIRNFAPVARIMKTALPENAKIAKEAKECMQECVSEFISFITSEGTSLSCLWWWSFGPRVSVWATRREADLSQRRRSAIRKRGKPSTARTSSSR